MRNPYEFGLAAALSFPTTPDLQNYSFYNPSFIFQYLALRRALHVRCIRDDSVPLTCIIFISRTALALFAKPFCKSTQKRLKFRFNHAWRVVTLLCGQNLLKSPHVSELNARMFIPCLARLFLINSAANAIKLSPLIISTGTAGTVFSSLGAFAHSISCK